MAVHRLQRRPWLRRNSAVLDRMALAGQLGVSFGGKRDIYTAAGYDKSITFEQYLARYLRGDVGRRVVDIYADHTWRKGVEVLDGASHEDAADNTPFVEAWRVLASSGKASGAETRMGVLHYLHRLDRLAGIGSYAVLLLGVADGKELSEPAEANSLSGPDGLIYTSVFHEGAAKVERYVTDRGDVRMGLPEMYQLTVRDSSGGQATVRAHWTRCIHVADGALTEDDAGLPRLQAPWNRLIDLDKVSAATGEAAYQLMNPGFVLTTKDGYSVVGVPADETDPEAVARAEAEEAAVEDQLDEFTHGFRRWLQLQGMDITELAGDLKDPTPSGNFLLRLVSAATGIPVRLLTGSERGELASTQDDDNWNDVIGARQQNFAGPAVLAPVLNRLIWLGALPAPSSGEFCFYWPPLSERSRTESADVAEKSAQALSAIGAVVDPQAFVEAFLPDLAADAVSAAPVAEPVEDAGAAVEPPAEAETAESEVGSATNAAPHFRRWVDYP